MSRLRVVYEVGHINRFGTQEADFGAKGGRVVEADCALIIATAAWKASRSEHSPVLITHGDYSERHAWAVRNGVRVYLAGHVNAHDDHSIGRGKFFYHHETNPGNGDRLAELLAEETAEVCSRLLGTAYLCEAISSNRTDWTRNAHGTIRKFGATVRGIAVCCEPFFISNPTHRRAFCTNAALTQIGQGYHRAVTRWESERAPIA